MLSRLTSYIYGGSASEPTPEQTNVSLRAIEQDDNDWLLVERGSNNGSLNGDDRPTLTDSEDECEVRRSPSPALSRRSPSPVLSRRSRRSSRCSQFSSKSRCSSASPYSLSYYRGMMEESWFVTPPPCFTNAELPSAIKTSSLENLLIEHPSLTVLEAHFESNYKLLMEGFKPEGGMERGDSTIEFYNSDEQLDSDALGDMICDDFLEYLKQARERLAAGYYRRNRHARPETTTETTVTPPPHEMHAEASQQNQEDFIAAGKIHKIMNKKTRRQSYNRGPMERNNKAREVNARNCKRRRSDHSQAQRNSRANNNRKC